MQEFGRRREQTRLPYALDPQPETLTLTSDSKLIDSSTITVLTPRSLASPCSWPWCQGVTLEFCVKGAGLEYPASWDFC